jgi:alpha-ribazole phosphatase
MKCTRLYLCRHGEVVGDGRRRYNGHRDVDITETGVKQMHRLREMLRDKPLTAIYSSDLIRTIKGAEIIGAHHHAQKLVRPEFRERNVGAWEGMAFEEIEAEYPDDWKAWLGDIVQFKPQGGESLLEVSERVLPNLRELVEKHMGEEVVLLGHGGVNRVILSDAMKLELRHVFRIEQQYGSLNIIDYYYDGMSVVKLLNG